MIVVCAVSQSDPLSHASIFDLFAFLRISGLYSRQLNILPGAWLSKLTVNIQGRIVFSGLSLVDQDRALPSQTYQNFVASFFQSA